MNNGDIDISTLPIIELPYLHDEEAGIKYNKWSFVNVYSLTALRDTYIVTKGISKRSVNTITNEINTLRVIKHFDKKWKPFTERQVLENLNALVKFGLLGKDYSIEKHVFINSKINSKLSKDDRAIFESIFFNYFRFKELCSWFINPSTDFHSQFENLDKCKITNDSLPLYYYSNSSRFYDTFLRSTKTPEAIYVIKNDILMRFWDVFLKWGTTLQLLDKFKMPQKRSDIINNDVNISYFIREFKPFNLKNFISENFQVKNIWLPDLILKIVEKHQYSVNEVKNFIVQNIQLDSALTFERTSEIFLIKGKTSKRNIRSATYLYPMLDDYYISNLICRL